MAFLGGIIGDALGAAGGGDGILGDVLGLVGGASGSDGSGGIGSLISDVEGLFGGNSSSGLGSDSVQQGDSQQSSSGSSTLGDIASIAATVLPLFL